MALTASMGVKLGPLMLLTLVKHFLERKAVTEVSQARDELLFDEAFIIVKSFLEASTRHTVEELQEFSNTRIPASPLIRSVRLMIPMSCCNDAATYLIQALGGQEQAAKVAGGTRWWQVRGVKGIDANWVVVKKDWVQAKKNQKERERQRQASSGSQRGKSTEDVPEEEDATYSSDMDSMRCMLYIHGGGYFFGSVDQERFCIQRYARKMNGRVLAINYRLAPQYPFPCAIHDALAAYLYLLHPPPEALHKPVPASKIVFQGDSAGGGTVLALLQVIRDSGLPLPAGAVLVSPWGDLTHSFPSVFQNTATDIIPPYGLSLYKPSTLWPPPSEEMGTEVRRRLTTRIRTVVNSAAAFSSPFSNKSPSSPNLTLNSDQGQLEFDTINPRTSLGDTVLPVDDSVGGSHAKFTPTISGAPQPGYPSKKSPQDLNHAKLPKNRGDPLLLDVEGKTVMIKSQIHLYAMNHQLGHPLVSPVMGYLGGLPPLYIMCSDKEVLRDEVIYMAHKAAHPDRFPLKDITRAQYPAMKRIEERFGPTDVHLQVYDETCHVLPLFSFTTPAKYCYRAVASFCKFVIPNPPNPHFASNGNTAVEEKPVLIPILSTDLASMGESPEESLVASTSSLPAATDHASSMHLPVPSSQPRPRKESQETSDDVVLRLDGEPPATPRSRSFTSSIFRRRSTRGQAVAHADSGESEDAPPTPTAPWSRGVPDTVSKSGPGVAGNPAVYSDVDGPPFRNHIIRERVSTQGVIRPLEPEADLAACTLPDEMLGVINEAATKRYLQGQAMWDKKFTHASKSVARHREKNLKSAGKESIKIMNQLQRRLSVNPSASSSRTSVGVSSPSATGSFAPSTNNSTNTNTTETIRGGRSLQPADSLSSNPHTMLNSPLWSWTWALEGENPPPSSLVARRDTSEARRLSKSADIHLNEDESRMSGNNLWAVVVDFLAATSGSTSSHSKTVPGAEDQDERPAADGGVAEAGSDDVSPDAPISTTNGHATPVPSTTSDPPVSPNPKTLRPKRSLGTLFRRFKGKHISSTKANGYHGDSIPPVPSPLSPGGTV